MNYVSLSPHFPPNYFRFAVHLSNLGVNVLGLADEPYDSLNSELKSALREYFWVPDMLNYDSMLRALGYFTHRYGKMDRVESLNEYWLETEARLRTDFNIYGFKTSDLPVIKRKSEMKKMFQKAGVEFVRGRLIRSREDAREFSRESGFPVVVKPDIGVGAARTYKIGSAEALEEFLSRSAEDYIVEEFVTGEIETFDGLTDKDGNIVFYTSHKYNSGVMEIVLEDSDLYYYSLRYIPPDLEQAGRCIVKAFDLRERFFHFEFFRTPDNRLVALEVNMRPPGGLTTDMFNYANDIDIYREWANIVVNNRFEDSFSWFYHCLYAGRKAVKHYAHSHDDILARFGSRIVQHQPMPGVMGRVMGDYAYLLRSPDLDEVLAAAAYILAKA